MAQRPAPAEKLTKHLPGHRSLSWWQREAIYLSAFFSGQRRRWQGRFAGDSVPPRLSPDARHRLGLAGADLSVVVALLFLTLPGTPIFYAGDELGMAGGDGDDHPPLDPFERRVPGYGLNRDPQRSPMQWSAALARGIYARQTVAPGRRRLPVPKRRDGGARCTRVPCFVPSPARPAQAGACSHHGRVRASVRRRCSLDVSAGRSSHRAQLQRPAPQLPLAGRGAPPDSAFE